VTVLNTASRIRRRDEIASRLAFRLVGNVSFAADSVESMSESALRVSSLRHVAIKTLSGLTPGYQGTRRAAAEGREWRQCRRRNSTATSGVVCRALAVFPSVRYL
jgi:hypothetical protein